MVYGDPSHGYHGISQSNLGIHHGFVGHQTWGSDGFRLGKMSRVMKARNQKGMHLVYLVYVYSFFFWDSRWPCRCDRKEGRDDWNDGEKLELLYIYIYLGWLVAPQTSERRSKQFALSVFLMNWCHLDLDQWLYLPWRHSRLRICVFLFPWWFCETNQHSLDISAYCCMPPYILLMGKSDRSIWHPFAVVLEFLTCISYLVGGLEHFLFFHILGMSSSQLTNSIIFRVGIPPTRYLFHFLVQHALPSMARSSWRRWCRSLGGWAMWMWAGGKVGNLRWCQSSKIRGSLLETIHL